jgi:hypothetical protein
MKRILKKLIGSKQVVGDQTIKTSVVHIRGGQTNRVPLESLSPPGEVTGRNRIPTGTIKILASKLTFVGTDANENPVYYENRNSKTASVGE